MTEQAVGWTDGSNGSSTSFCGAAGYVIALKETGEILDEQAKQFPHGLKKFTSNDMEMAGILLCLQAAERMGLMEIDVRSDSQWAVNIITGDFTLRDKKFVGVLEEIRELGLSFRRVSIKHVPREHNARADWLCRSATGQKNRTHIPSLCW